MSALTKRSLLAGQRRPEIGRRLSISNFCLFCHIQRIVYFNPNISDDAFQLRVTQEQLHCPQVFRATVYKRSFGAAHYVRAID